MSENNNICLIAAVISFIILSLCYGFATEFGGKYFSPSFWLVNFGISGIVFHKTKDKTDIIVKIIKITKSKIKITKSKINQQINKQINNKMKFEILEYIQIIKGCSDEELGIAVLSALTLRKRILNSSGIDLMDPVIALNKNPDITITLSKTHAEFTAQNKPQLTVPYTIWAHTLRSVSNPLIRALGRQMWIELSRGFNHVESQKNNYRLVYDNEPNSELLGQYPIGLEPLDIENKNDVTKEKISSYEQEKKLMEYIQLHKKGLITQEALTNLQIELLSKK